LDLSSFESSTAGSIACLLISGPIGAPLFSRLMKDFRGASRYDTFLGVSVAVAIMAADLAIAEAELAQARQGLR
jgi:hypothetical protein